jgi:hypothetical protein
MGIIAIVVLRLILRHAEPRRSHGYGKLAIHGTPTVDSKVIARRLRASPPSRPARELP